MNLFSLKKISCLLILPAWFYILYVHGEALGILTAFSLDLTKILRSCNNISWIQPNERCNVRKSFLIVPVVTGLYTYVHALRTQARLQGVLQRIPSSLSVPPDCCVAFSRAVLFLQDLRTLFLWARWFCMWLRSLNLNLHHHFCLCLPGRKMVAILNNFGESRSQIPGNSTVCLRIDLVTTWKRWRVAEIRGGQTSLGHPVHVVGGVQWFAETHLREGMGNMCNTLYNTHACVLKIVGSCNLWSFSFPPKLSSLFLKEGRKAKKSAPLFR